MVRRTHGDLQMTDTVQSAEALPNPSLPGPKVGQASRTAPSKLARKLLRRGKGATLAELQNATAWQRHSVRAFLSGLRKKGDVLIKEQRKSGEVAYRVTVGKVAAAAAHA